MACCRCWHAACRRVGGRRARTTGWRRASGAGGDAQCKCMAGVGGGSGRGGGHHFPARGWWPCVDSRHPPGHDGGPYNRLCGDADCVSCDSRGRGRGWRCRRARPRRWPLPAAADRRRLCQRRGGDGGGPGRSVGPVLAPARRRGCARDALWRRRLVDDGQRGGKCARWGGGDDFTVGTGVGGWLGGTVLGVGGNGVGVSSSKDGLLLSPLCSLSTLGAEGGGYAELW